MSITLSNAGLESLPSETFVQFGWRAVVEHDRRGDIVEAAKWRRAIRRAKITCEVCGEPRRFSLRAIIADRSFHPAYRDSGWCYDCWRAIVTPGAASPALTKDEITESGLVELCCDTCRDHTGLPPLPAERIADDTWYYCPRCHTQWIATNTWRDRWPPLGDVLFASLFLMLIGTGLLGITLLIAQEAMSRGGRPYLDAHPGWLLAALAVGGFTWLALVIIGSHIFNAATYAVRGVVWWVWGEPLWWCAERAGDES